MMWFDLGGAATVGFSGPVESAVVAYASSQLRPYRPATAPEPPDLDVVLARSNAERDAPLPGGLEIQNDAGDGLRTAWDGERTWILDGTRRCSLPDPMRDRPAVVEYQAGFPLWDIWGDLVRPVVALAALRHDAVVIHASAVEIDGRAVLVGGWSESGKTEVALALCERGGRFISDKWTIVRLDGSVLPFPAPAGIRSWVLPYLPRLRSALRPTEKVQVAGARLASTVTSPLRRSRDPRLAVRAAAGAADRVTAVAARVSTSIERLRTVYGGDAADMCNPVPLGSCVLLATAPGSGVEIGTADATAVAARLADAAVFERMRYFGVGQRMAYAAGGPRRTGPEDVARIERERLERVLSGVRLMRVATGFPADPRPASDAIAGALG